MPACGVIVWDEEPWIMGACGAKAGWAMGWYWYVGATVAGACGRAGGATPGSGWRETSGPAAPQACGVV